jgi:hypothetical protein
MSVPTQVSNWNLKIEEQEMRANKLLSELDLPFPFRRDTQVLIACGYFDTSTGIDEFAVESMRAGLLLGDELRRTYALTRKPFYSVVVNDLGMDCSQDVCQLKPVAPADINTSVLQEICAPFEATFEVVRERTMRNRAARFLKRWQKDMGTDRTVRLQGNEILFDSSLYQKVIAGAVNRDGVGIPRCPLIVSEYLELSFKRLSASKQQSCRVVFDFNRVADKDKVIKGTEMYLARKAEGQEAVVQVFFDAETHDFVSIPYDSEDLGRSAA